MVETRMRYAIQIEQQNGHYHASVLTVPTLTKSAASRSEVLRLIEEALLEHVRRTEIVYVDIPTVDTPAVADHWLATAGLFADDPTLLPMLDEIYAERDRE
jgi:predicted RNase H-like HicB family nuclease